MYSGITKFKFIADAKRILLAHLKFDNIDTMLKSNISYVPT